MVTVTLENMQQVAVPVPALRLLAELLRDMARGHAVLVVSYGTELTTQQAADLLNVSRPYVVKLIEGGQLPARKVGPRRRVRFEDLVSFKRADDAHRREVARQLTSEAEEMGLGYLIPAEEKV
jgi:excisionase family DNA binding protein